MFVLNILFMMPSVAVFETATWVESTYKIKLCLQARKKGKKI